MQFRKVVVLFFVLFTGGLHAQTNRDSLRTLLATNVKPIDRYEVLENLAKSFAGRDHDSTLYYGRLALNESVKNGLEDKIYSGHSLIGNAFFGKGEYDSALFHYKEALDMARIENDSTRISAILNNMGSVYTYSSRYEESIDYLLQALVIREQTGDPRISSTVNNLGNAYYRMEDLDKALVYYYRAAELKEAEDQRQSAANTYNNIGIILKNQGKIQEAIPYYEKSLGIALEYDDRQKAANAYNNLATLYEEVELFRESDNYYQKAIALKLELGDQAGLINSYANHAIVLSKMGRTQQAFAELALGDSLNALVGNNLYSAANLQAMAFVLEKAGRYKEAIQAIREAMNIRVEALNEDRNERIAEMEVKFETANKEAEILRLKMENELSLTQVQSTRNQLIGLVIFIIGFVIFLILFYTLRLRKKEAERLAQEHQLDALQKRFLEIQQGIPQIPVSLDLEEFNKKLHNELTEREFEALKLSLGGKSNNEIGKSLFISQSTVKFHLRNTYNKLGVQNRKEALAYVVKSS